MNTKYKKKPVVVNAFQMTTKRRENNSDWPDWLHKAWNEKEKDAGSLWCVHTKDKDTFFCGTLEGMHKVSINDWIIQGIKGEIYPCKPDIFELTYEDAKEIHWTIDSIKEKSNRRKRALRELNKKIELLSKSEQLLQRDSTTHKNKIYNLEMDIGVYKANLIDALSKIKLLESEINKIQHKD